jgi:hypothetical protein
MRAKKTHFGLFAVLLLVFATAGLSASATPNECGGPNCRSVLDKAIHIGGSAEQKPCSGPNCANVMVKGDEGITANL